MSTKTASIPAERRRIQGKNEQVAIKSSQSQVWVLALVLAVCTMAVYHSASSFPFVNYDDPDYVTHNPHVQAGLTHATVSWAVRSTEFSNWHPVTWISHALDYQIWGGDASGHHITSVLIHTLNAVLLFLLLAFATGEAFPSFFVAALFAVHPMNVESVAWIAERKTVLSLFFMLLATGAYGWYVRKPSFARYASVFVLFALALMAKPMVVSFPFLLLLWDYWPLQRVGIPGRHRKSPFPISSWRSLIVEKLPLLLLTAASCLITLVAQRGSMAPSSVVPLNARLWNAVQSYLVYLAKTIWPFYLAVYYPFHGTRWWSVLCLLVLLALAVMVWRWRERKYLVVGFLWFLGTMVPMIGLVQVGTQSMADRYGYLPLIGIFIAVCWGVRELTHRRGMDQQFMIAGGVLVVFFAFLAVRQIRVWDSSIDLWRHALEVTSGNYVAQDNLAYELLAQGQPEEALASFQEAAKLSPEDPLSHWALAAYSEDRGDLKKAAENYEIVIQNPESSRQLAAAYLHASVIASELGNYQRASDYSTEAQQTDSDLINSLVSEAKRTAEQSPSSMSYLRFGLLLEQAGQITQAQDQYQRAIKLDPGDSLASRLLTHLQKSHSGS